MKTIGLLGGMSWESTEHYYRLINEATRQTLGGLHSAPIAMVSVDFHELEEMQHAGDWAAIGRILADRAAQVEAAGAELLLICTNTMHLDVVVPSQPDRDIVHRVIYEELCLGRIEDESRAEYLRIIDDLRQRGAEAVIEGCTEIGLLVKQEHTDVPLFDTTTIHAHQAVAAALT